MATAAGSSAESEALKHAFAYLVDSIDTASVLPISLSRGLISERQGSECNSEPDPYRKAEKFLFHLQREVNGDSNKYHVFKQILKTTGRDIIASRLGDEYELAKANMSMPPGEQLIVPPDELLEELAGLRMSYARFLHEYKKVLQGSAEAQEKFVETVPDLIHRELRPDHSFQSYFSILKDEEVSLFNITYLKLFCSFFPDDVCTATKKLVDEYEKHRQHFMASTTVNQFKALFPASATSSKLLTEKFSVELKLRNVWGSHTLDDLKSLIGLFGVPGKYLHLSNIKDGCIAVAWLCSTSFMKELKVAVAEATDLLQAKGVLKVFIEKELVLECSQPDQGKLQCPTSIHSVKRDSHQFYQWVRDRYPCVSQVVRFHQLPDYENLYIDMNDVISECAGCVNEEHENPNDATVTSEVIEEKLLTYVCQYIEALFWYVRPRKLLFLAVDGVSPLAKLNNKRADLFTKKAASECEKMLKSSFNVDSIGCGTEFMERLHKHLQYFIIKQQSHDPAWQKVEVILSGHLVPGEGKHKMMDHIRYQRAQPGYDPNTRHCLYTGQDSDFILLGLVTHEPYITLVYEFFWSGEKRLSHIPKAFRLFHFSILREYIEAEFSSLKGSLSFDYNLEAIIDDWVLMVCFLGNDFIPAIPNDKQDILSVLFETYLQVLPSLGGYIQGNGILNLERYKKYIAALVEDKFDEGTREERQEHYRKTFTHLNVRDQNLPKVVESYVTGVQWVLQYYYTGMPSWDWYYPYHYAPFMSDLKQFSGQPLKEFEVGEAMFPLHQMLAKLHPASSALLPKAYQCLVVNKDSPLIDFFPTDFDPDDNWGQIVFHSYIDKDKLLKAVKPYNEQLTAEEKERNEHSPCLLYTHDDQVAAGHTYCSPCPGSTMFPDIVNCKSNCKDLSITPFPIKKKDMVFGLCQGVSLDHYVPGFPTFQHIPHKTKIEFANRYKSVREFKNVTVQPQAYFSQNVADLAIELVGKTCYIEWPYLVEAKVRGLSDQQHWYACDFQCKDQLKQQEKDVWWKQVTNFTKHHWKELGISVDCTEVQVVVEVQKLIGRQYVLNKHGPRGSLTVIKQWSNFSTYHPLQTIVRVEDITLQYQEAISTLEQLFHNGDQCFLLMPDKYGEQAEVTSVDIQNEQVHVKLKKSPVEPNMEPVHRRCSRLKTDYSFLFEDIADELMLKREDLNRITGSLYCRSGSSDSDSESESKYGEGNIGLKLKFHNKEIVGYSHWIGSQCFLSQDAKDLIYEYKKRFPSVFDYFAIYRGRKRCYFEMDLFPSDTGGLQTCLNWLESLPTWNKYINPVPYGAISLNQSQISEVQSAVMKEMDQVARVKPERCEDIQIHPSNLFMPTDHQGGLIPDLKASYAVLDRVVNVSRSCPVPLGLRGTVIGASIPSDKSDDHAIIEVLFDQEFPTGVSIRGSKRNCYCLPMCCLINLSRGRILVERLHQHQAKDLDREQTKRSKRGRHGDQEQRYHGPSKWSRYN